MFRMITTSKFKSFIILVLSFFTVTAFSGDRETGNGGDFIAYQFKSSAVALFQSLDCSPFVKGRFAGVYSKVKILIPKVKVSSVEQVYDVLDELSSYEELKMRFSFLAYENNHIVFDKLEWVNASFQARQKIILKAYLNAAGVILSEYELHAVVNSVLVFDPVKNDDKLVACDSTARNSVNYSEPEYDSMNMDSEDKFMGPKNSEIN